MLFPDAIMEHIAGGILERNKTGCSGASVYKIDKAGSSLVMYLKVAENPKDTCELQYESVLLSWLEERLPVPRVIANTLENGRFYLLMSAIDGVPAHEVLHEDKVNCIILLAQGLARIHSLETAICPFDQRLEERLTSAARNIAWDAVDVNDFGEDARGMTAGEILDKLKRTRPASEDLVFTHGDYCLPNIILKDGAISGFIDMGRAGVSDRYQDIALALRSLRYNLSYFGERSWSLEDDRLFLEAYGLRNDEFDPDKAAYYRLLDELF